MDKEQLKMDIDPNGTEYWDNLRNEVNRFERTIEARPFWRSLLSIFTLITIIFVFVTTQAILYINSSELPESVPLIFSHTSSSWDLVDTFYLYVVSGVIFVIQLIVFFLTYKLHKFDRRLSQILNSILIYMSLIYLIAFGQIVSLVII